MARRMNLYWQLSFAAFAQAALLLTSVASAATVPLSNEAALESQASGSNAGTISGTITDPSGAIVAGAHVTLKNAVTNYQQDVQSNSSGMFQFVNVPHNQYHFSVSAPGFESVSKDIAVRTAVPVQVNVQLKLSGATEEVTVQASAADLVEDRKSV